MLSIVSFGDKVKYFSPFLVLVILIICALLVISNRSVCHVYGHRRIIALTGAFPMGTPDDALQKRS